MKGGGASRPELRAYFSYLDAVSYALRHLEVIERFSRFPHRNAILGRESTPAEIAFLEERAQARRAAETEGRSSS
jgi:uncharacterized protein (DUF924 family)